jgi:hypothetical protein
MVKPSVLLGEKLRALVGPEISWLHRILYGERRGQCGARAPSFGLHRPLAFVAWARRGSVCCVLLAVYALRPSPDRP